MAWFAIYVLVSFQNPHGFSKSGRDLDLQYTHLVPKCCFAFCQEFTLYRFIFSTKKKKWLTEAFLDRQFHESVSLVASFSVLKIGGPFYVKTPFISNHFSKYTYLTARFSPTELCLSQCFDNCMKFDLVSLLSSIAPSAGRSKSSMDHKLLCLSLGDNFFTGTMCTLLSVLSLTKGGVPKKVVIFQDICH